jgi:cyanophycinase
VLDALWDMYRRGGVIAGTSAGAAIMSSTMFGRPRAVLATLKLGVTDGKEITSGLGFIGEDVFVDQHLLVRGRFARMLPAMLAKGYKLGLGIDEDTAMVVRPTATSR